MDQAMERTIDLAKRDRYFTLSYSGEYSLMDYIYALYSNLRNKMRGDFEEKNFLWRLGTEIIREISVSTGRLYYINTTEQNLTLYGIRVEEDRVNTNAIQLYEDITNFLGG